MTKSEIIDSAYRHIHKRFNPQEYTWEEFIPAARLSSDPEGVIFNLIYQYPWTPTKSLQKLIDVRSECLKETLRSCLKFIHTLPDDDEYECDDETSGGLQIDLRKLAAHDDLLKAELSSLKMRLNQEEDLETRTLDGENQLSPMRLDETEASTSTTEEMETTSKPATAVLRAKIHQLQKLLCCINTEFATTKRKIDALLACGEISYDLLWWLFRDDMFVTFVDHESGLAMAGKITSTSYRESNLGKSFQITVRYIDYNGVTLYYAARNLTIDSFPKSANIGLLDVQPLKDDKLREYLKSRGRDFVRLQGVHHLEYHDYLLIRGTFGQLLKFGAAGRAMVDASSYQRMNLRGHGDEPCEEDKIRSVSEDELILCASTVLGYSFVTKQWGRLIADKFSPILWSKEAFDHLVLSEPIKQLIQSLVRADRKNVKVIKDVIAGKGGGCIIVLHGRPGTGKTLTAEAVAEEQEKPLMTVSVGELGTNAKQVEAKLTEILELAALWDAVLLLDEADVFLEARSLHELERNAMVGVFLRLLEYHQRVMFLTTNRVRTLDEAFKSRISVAIKYQDLDEKARRTIWENFLRLAGVNIVDDLSQADTSVSEVTTEQVLELATKKLNGREIKNAMRTAQALAVSTKRPLRYDLIKQVLEIVAQFDEDFKE